MAGFQVIMYGRFWVFTEVRTGLQSGASTASAFSAKEKLFFRGNNNY